MAACATRQKYARQLSLCRPASGRRVLRCVVIEIAVDEREQSQGNEYCTPPCALLPALAAHVVTVQAGIPSSPPRLALTLPPSGTPSRSVAAFPLVRRSLPVTETCHLGGLLGHEPGGARRASQAAHTADPCARWLCRCIAKTWRETVGREGEGAPRPRARRQYQRRTHAGH